jgi:hypothetical protein
MLILIAPTLGWTWPALVPIMSVAAGYLGFKKFTSYGEGAWEEGELTQRMREQRIVEIPLASETVEPIADEMGRDEMLTFQRDDCILIIHKKFDGRMNLRIMGPRERSAQELSGIGTQFATTLIQQFAYSRVVRELDRKGITVVAEQRDENGDLVLRTRKWG